jgi:two-component system phosphate regulon response regulator OmpR
VEKERGTSKSKMATVLLIDDDERLNRLVTTYLDRFGFSVRAFTHPEQGLRALNSDHPDIVILDVMLPDIDGFALCRKIREFSRIPVVMLTARGDVTDRIVGLELGADDYLPKPFEPRELLARLQAVLRRGARIDSEERTRIGPLDVNWATRSVHMNGRDLALTTAEFELLQLLVRNRSRVLSRDRILDKMRGIDWEAYDRSIDVLISRLRQKLGDDPKCPTFIRTVRGAGYLFIGGHDD